MPKSNEPPRRLHPLNSGSQQDASWQRRQWRRYLDTTIDATIDTIAQHLTPPDRPQRPQPTRTPASGDPSLPSLPSPATRSSAPPSAPTSGSWPGAARPETRRPETRRPETREETIARLTPKESLFDRSIAERRRQHHANRSKAPSPERHTVPAKPARPAAPPRRSPEPVAKPFGNVTPFRRNGAKPPIATNRASAPSARPPSRSRRKTPLSPLIYGARLAIVGVGLSAIAGTMLSAISPTPDGGTDPDRVSTPESLEPQALPVSFQRTQEIASLSAQMRELAARYPDFLAGVSLVDVDTGAFVSLNGDTSLAAASTIKLPIAIAFFQAVDRGEIRLDEPLALKPEHVAIGSGTMQFDAPGTEYTALEVVTKTIVISDNTATNILIERLGGLAALNSLMRSWGMADTTLNAPLPDLAGTNVVTPDDLTYLLSSIDRGELISLRSRDRLLDILQATENNSLLPQALGTGATIAHKTGNIKHSLGDTGLIDLPNGKRYILSTIVKRPAEDARAAEIIRQVSQLAHDYFSGANYVPPAADPSVPETQQAQRALDRPEP